MEETSTEQQKVSRNETFKKEAAEEKKSEFRYVYNKEVAKCADIPLPERANAAVHAVKDKVEQIAHNMKKEWNREPPSEDEEVIPPGTSPTDEAF